MSTIAIQSNPISQCIRLVASKLSHMFGPSVETEIDVQDNRARRDFVLEMMDAHPEAFQHEIDCQTMMTYYPSRF